MTQFVFVGTENGSSTVPDPDPLEQMLIEHPSMSVYQRRCGVNEEEEEEEERLDTDEDLCRLLLRSLKTNAFPLTRSSSGSYWFISRVRQSCDQAAR